MSDVTSGAQAPLFSLPDAQGHPWQLEAALVKQPAVLVFYRGDW
jgi:peroxiredoxin